jgi:hypothetical protein
MNELIPIDYDNIIPTVSGRDLHEACAGGDPIQGLVSANVRVRLQGRQGL